MLDVTWEAPDGTITPLDGYLDPYFQEVYLEADSIPLFTKLVSHLSSDALDEYVAQLEKEVHKYVAKDPKNYGKAAKRMYNIFRLNGSYEEAAYLRELFDEPTAVLYQVGAVVRTLDEAAQPGSAITSETLLSQLDALILDVVATLDGDHEVEVVRELLRLRATITEGDELDVQSAAVDAARGELTNIVNNFFYDKLTGLRTIAEYMASAAAG
jgi:antitoxin component HigA of HigAB toxin-antitoxin module